MIWKYACSASVMLLSLNAFSDLSDPSPDRICNLMVSEDLGTRGWKNRYGEVFGCSSDYKDIGTSFPLPNNVAYYAEGSRNRVRSAKLVLNVNDTMAEQSAITALLKSANVLCQKISNSKPPPQLVEAIKGKKSISATLGSTKAEIKIDFWPTGKGYEIHVIFK